MRDFAGLIPAKGFLPIAGDTLILRKTLVYIDSSGQADDTATVGNVYGVASSTVDNRSTAPSGGAAGAEDIDVEFGMFEFAYTGGVPTIGQVLFGVDNNTVSTSSAGGTLGIAGYCTDVNPTTSRCFVLVGPTIVAQIILAADVAADLATAEAAIDALEANAITAQACIPVPVTSFLADGLLLENFVDGTKNGVALVDSECVGFRWNPVGQDTTTLSTSVALPQDLDDAAAVVIHALVFRVGSSDTTAVIAGAGYFQTVGAAHTADDDCITVDTAAIAAATTVVQEVTLAIAAADVPPAPCSLTFTLTPSSALDADDLVVTSVWIEYTRKVLAA
jgi:hypothetical protein